MTTDYLAAALSRILIDTGGGCDVGELQAQLPDYYNGEATHEQIVRELDALIAADSVYQIVDGGETFYYDNSE